MKEVLNMDENYKKLEQFRLAVLGKKQPKQRKKKKEKIKYCFNEKLTRSKQYASVVLSYKKGATEYAILWIGCFFRNNN